MFIVIWEISSSMGAVKTGKSWMKFDSQEGADMFAVNLEKTNRETGFFSFNDIEVLEVA